MFSCQFCEIFVNSFVYRTPPEAASNFDTLTTETSLLGWDLRTHKCFQKWLSIAISLLDWRKRLDSYHSLSSAEAVDWSQFYRIRLWNIWKISWKKFAIILKMATNKGGLFRNSRKNDLSKHQKSTEREVRSGKNHEAFLIGILIFNFEVITPRKCLHHVLLQNSKR